MLLQAFAQLDRGWVWLYTAGMHPEDATRRRAELDSDQWELAAYAARRGWSELRLLAHMLARWLLGIPADISWRLELGMNGVHRGGIVDLASAALVLGGFGLGVPAAILFTMQGPGVDPDSYNTLLFTYAFIVVALLCVGGVAVQELRPVAGTIVALVGVFSLSLVLWWTVTIPLMGVAATVTLIYRGRRLQH